MVLLVSCKSLSRRAEPAHVQEWGAVVNTMNRYSNGTLYFGLVISPTGFSSGCEAWATSHNLGIVPPLKGRKLTFDEETVFRMFERVLVALKARVRLLVNDLKAPPAFFDFVYRFVADFEGHQEADVNSRYLTLPHRWTSSFGEMYRAVAQRTIQDLWADHSGATLALSGGVVLRIGAAHVEFGQSPGAPPPAVAVASACFKNIDMQPCDLDLVKSIAVGRAITSAGDFGAYVEVGLDKQFNLGLHPTGFHIVSTENPVEEHGL